ncbi:MULTISPECIES: molybdenum cofactor guanylyltransferase MobA [Ramlibacter]|uniref:Molybdenum cofactor guanylyltransferase n=1 Tax=Ramlibacter aquaticus TaxID=2780094 RepID=A0ABR9SDP8_9BURK|nr:MULTISPECIES: molybdenum cofactor guanylyltransferase MobA [Ramlibacter]MBE7940177.1 molybdenum cofactor guanylyltransferase MobA [Ramlibacter aquaticus]
MLAPQDVTGVVLAGGRGSRMGGVDKGLQNFNGMPLALHALMRLGMQVGETLVNANRNLAAYEAFGAPVWPDAAADYPGPLAGFLCGLAHCETPWLVTVPCDTPLFPLDLVQRLGEAALAQDAEIAMACAREEDGQLRTQPVFCLLQVGLLESLLAFVQSGGRKIDAWTAQHRVATVTFDRPGDDPRAFFNANTLDELRRLELP